MIYFNESRAIYNQLLFYHESKGPVHPQAFSAFAIGKNHIPTPDNTVRKNINKNISHNEFIPLTSPKKIATHA